MQESPTGGYVVEAKDLLPLLPNTVHDEYDQYVHDLDCDEAHAVLNLNLLPMFLKPVELFVFAEEDTCEELETGVMYARFDEADLFVQVPTEKGKKLERFGIVPVHHSWSIWG